MKPDNVLIGDTDFGTALPEFVPPEEEMRELQSMANHTTTPEYARLVDWCEGKIEQYQQFLPGNGIVSAIKPTTEDWRVADRVISDLKEFMGIYESAKILVNDKANEQ